MTLEERIGQWYQAGKHEDTVKNILELPKQELTCQLAEELAVAYNKLGNYEKSIEILQKTKDISARSCRWYYCMGYALYYMAMNSSDQHKRHSLLYSAFDSFCEAITLISGQDLETECLEFLEWIDEDLCDLSLPFDDIEETNSETIEEVPTLLLEKPDNQFYGLDESSPASREGAFICSVLLSNPWFDHQQFIRDFYHDWNLHLTENNHLTFSIDHMTASISLMPVPVPKHEAETHAARNYLWPGAEEAAKTHKAHLLITVWGQDCSSIDLGKLFVKITATCCHQVHVIGVCTNGVVLQPSFYRNLALMVPNGSLPILNWIWFGLYETKEGVSGYTYGLELFGKEEIEVLNANAEPNEIRSFLVDVTSYVLEKDIVLHDGECIGFSETINLPITHSRGIALPGMTLKIAYEIPCASPVQNNPAIQK